ncbi:MAG TPA: hypothetical protein DD979_05565 [Gammaproteobacteria bacterium]|nr:hypothetical protein [Gammaproteobacteria bacterium]
MLITADFDGGNIHCLDCTDPADVRLEIAKDNASDFYQWFYFRTSQVKGQACVYHITNAAGAAYPGGWENYRAVASYNRRDWFRVETHYDGQTLSIHHQSKHNAVYYAYFAPYSMERHADLIADLQASPRVSLDVLGRSLDGQDLDLLRVAEGEEAGKKSVWVIARQHPGETMAEWWMEGFLHRLIDRSDAVSRALLDRAVFYVVPNMNPDGSRRGHLRTNAVGANLNREWSQATLAKSPEVYYVRERMHQTGVDVSLDIHGDEALPYNFIAGTHGIAAWSPEREVVLERYKSTLKRLNPDFQTQYGYPPNPPGTANLGMCSNYVAQTFGCLAMTIEMPFKDTADTPDDVNGWSPSRSDRLGRSHLDALHALMDVL